MRTTMKASKVIRLALGYRDGKVGRSFLFFLAISLISLDSAEAQSPEFMMEGCRSTSRLFFEDFTAQSDAKYEGQREDGTHYVNGTIFIGDAAEHFQCSYDASGRAMVDFWVEERSWLVRFFVRRD